MKREIARLDRVTLMSEEGIELDGMNLRIYAGEILGLICINSQGRDALVELLCRNLPLHYGYVYFQEQLVNSYRGGSRGENRVEVIEARSRLVGELSVADNIFVLRRGFRKYFINSRQLEEQMQRFTSELELDILGSRYICDLSAFERCVVELLRAIVLGAKLVVLQDLSNFIGFADLERFQQIVRYYAEKGVAFLYVCNHHEEAFEICNRLALMENGKIRKLLCHNEFRHEIIGHYCLDFRRARPPLPESDGLDGALRFRHVTTDNLQDLSFMVEKGECVALLDISNTALSDVFSLMTGTLRDWEGQVLLDGLDWPLGGVELQREVYFLCENPIKTMLFQEMSYLDNLCFSLDRRYPGFWRRSRIKQSVRREYADLVGEDIDAQDIARLPQMSLYNLVYYSVHLYRPKVVFISQPFAGADMYLRHHLIDLMGRLRERNITVVILAVSLADCLVVADRLITLEKGRLVRAYSREEFLMLRPSISGKSFM